MKKYALLFAGCVDDNYYEQRYYNDLGFIYSVLDNNNYQRIDVLFYDGRDINFDSNKISTIPATKANFITTIMNYKNELQSEDQLFLFVSNHGGAPILVENVARNMGVEVNEAYINCFGYESIGESLFTKALELIAGNKIVIMGQCYGGNFVNLPISNTVIISANIADKPSYSSNSLYDDFLYHFTAYLNGQYYNNTPLKNNTISTKDIKGAFEYSKVANEFCQNPNHFVDPSGNPVVEYPQLKSSIHNELHI